ncbi:MAG: helix-turn-helix domain-containing protein [Candidatus Nanopelagicales bacterium]|jgi:AraC-like DNA-binding protein|nr:helix-turn-helix domain-containing protein [Candidatus Nanopelagicales bacterium]
MARDPSRILADNGGPLHEVFGLACGLSLVPAMRRAHRHDDVELVLPRGGAAVLEHAGARHELADRRCAVFRAGLPHRVADHEPGVTMAWATVPLADVLTWSLPAAFVGSLLRGGLLVFDAPPALESAMDSWQHDIGASPALTRAARLEAQAWLLRAAAIGDASAPGRAPDAATAMASHVATHFREPLAVADVAAVVHLHPSTAATVFRREMGVTIGEYLAQCRVAEAQRLLISTDETTSTVALRAGFGSTSRFYERFVRDVGVPPAAYRRAMR